MNFRLFGVLLALTLLLAACGRRLPEEGVASSASGAAVAEAPTTAEQPDDVQAEAAEADDAMATEEADAPDAATEETDNAEGQAVEATEETADADTATEAADEADTAEAVAVAGDPVIGQKVFNQSYDTASGPWICASCHSVDESQIRLVGPGMWGLAQTAEERIVESGEDSVTEYIHNSIVHPNDYIVPGDSAGPYPENLMPANYGDILSEEELDGLVAYIITLQ